MVEYERKPGIPNSGVILVSDDVRRTLGEDSWVASAYEHLYDPVAGRAVIDDIDAFCAAGQIPAPGNYNAGDFVIGVGGILKAQQWAQHNQFPVWCQAKEETPALEGGQCAVEYYLAWHYRYVDSSGQVLEAGGPDYETPPNFNRFSKKAMGPITGPIEITDVDQPFWTFLDGNGDDTGALAFLSPGGEFTHNFPHVERVDGGSDDCGDPPPIIPPPPETDPPPTIEDPPPDFEFPPPRLPDIGPPGPPGLPGPCPTLTGGTVTITPGSEPTIEFESTGDCEYGVNLVIPGLETETKNALFGVEYTVKTQPPYSKFNITAGGQYFIPRCGSIRFKNNSTGVVSEHTELHGEKGFIPNPRPTYFDSWELTNHTGYVVETSGVRREVEVATGILFEQP